MKRLRRDHARPTSVEEERDHSTARAACEPADCGARSLRSREDLETKAQQARQARARRAKLSEVAFSHKSRQAELFVLGVAGSGADVLACTSAVAFFSDATSAAT